MSKPNENTNKVVDTEGKPVQNEQPVQDGKKEEKLRKRIARRVAKELLYMAIGAGTVGAVWAVSERKKNNSTEAGKTEGSAENGGEGSNSAEGISEG